MQLAAAVCSARRMTAATIRLFTEGAPDEVVLPELTQLEPAPLAAAVAGCTTPRRVPCLGANSCARLLEIMTAGMSKGGCIA